MSTSSQTPVASLRSRPQLIRQFSFNFRNARQALFQDIRQIEQLVFRHTNRLVDARQRIFSDPPVLLLTQQPQNLGSSLLPKLAMQGEINVGTIIATRVTYDPAKSLRNEKDRCLPAIRFGEGLSLELCAGCRRHPRRLQREVLPSPWLH